MERAIVAEYHSILASLANRCLTRAYPGAAVQGIVPAIKDKILVRHHHLGNLSTIPVLKSLNSAE